MMWVNKPAVLNTRARQHVSIADDSHHRAVITTRELIYPFRLV